MPTYLIPFLIMVRCNGGGGGGGGDKNNSHLRYLLFCSPQGVKFRFLLKRKCLHVLLKPQIAIFYS